MAEALPAAHTGPQPIVCMQDRAVSMPSASPNPSALGSASRMTPAAPSILLGPSIAAFPRPSRSKYVRWMPHGLPVTGSVISATMAGSGAPLWPRGQRAWNRITGSSGSATPRCCRYVSTIVPVGSTDAHQTHRAASIRDLRSFSASASLCSRSRRRCSRSTCHAARSFGADGVIPAKAAPHCTASPKVQPRAYTIRPSGPPPLLLSCEYHAPRFGLRLPMRGIHACPTAIVAGRGPACGPPAEASRPVVPAGRAAPRAAQPDQCGKMRWSCPHPQRHTPGAKLRKPARGQEAQRPPVAAGPDGKRARVIASRTAPAPRTRITLEARSGRKVGGAHQCVADGNIFPCRRCLDPDARS